MRVVAVSVKCPLHISSTLLPHFRERLPQTAHIARRMFPTFCMIPGFFFTHIRTLFMYMRPAKCLPVFFVNIDHPHFRGNCPKLPISLIGRFSRCLPSKKFHYCQQIILLVDAASAMCPLYIPSSLLSPNLLKITLNCPYHPSYVSHVPREFRS